MSCRTAGECAIPRIDAQGLDNVSHSLNQSNSKRIASEWGQMGSNGGWFPVVWFYYIHGSYLASILLPQSCCRLPTDV